MDLWDPIEWSSGKRQVCSGWRWPRKWATASAELQLQVDKTGAKRITSIRFVCVPRLAVPCNTCSVVRCPHLCKRTVAPWFARLDDSKGYATTRTTTSCLTIYCNVCTHELLHMLVLHGLGQHTHVTHSLTYMSNTSAVPALPLSGVDLSKATAMWVGQSRSLCSQLLCQAGRGAAWDVF